MRSASAHNSTAAVSVTEIRAELEKVLQSAELERCPQLQRFLHFVVEEELAGRGTQLKEYVLGVGVFGRPPDFDPRLDSLVRVEARRLRAALEKYYRGEGHADPVVIELQKGSYLPAFRRPAESSEVPAVAEKSEPTAHWAGRIVLGAVVIVALAIVLVAVFRSRHVQALTERDSIVLTEFVNTTGDPIFDDALKQGLTMELEQSPFLNDGSLPG